MIEVISEVWDSSDVGISASPMISEGHIGLAELLQRICRTETSFLFSATLPIWVKDVEAASRLPSLEPWPSGPEAVSGQIGYGVPPVCSGSSLRLLPVGPE